MCRKVSKLCYPPNVSKSDYEKLVTFWVSLSSMFDLKPLNLHLDGCLGGIE